MFSPRGSPSELICGENHAPALSPLPWDAGLYPRGAAPPRGTHSAPWASASPSLHNTPLNHYSYHAIHSAADVLDTVAGFYFLPVSTPKQQGDPKETAQPFVPTLGTPELIRAAAGHSLCLPRSWITFIYYLAQSWM